MCVFLFLFFIYRVRAKYDFFLKEIKDFFLTQGNYVEVKLNCSSIKLCWKVAMFMAAFCVVTKTAAGLSSCNRDRTGPRSLKDLVSDKLQKWFNDPCL